MASSPSPTVSLATAVPGAETSRLPKNMVEAARQFEALLIEQLLKGARGNEQGWLGTGEETGDATSAELAEEQFAQALANQGGLGLSAQIVRSLSASSAWSSKVQRGT